MAAKLQNINLELFRKNSPWKKQEFSGLLTALWDASGPWRKPGQIKGGGTLSVSQGVIWKFNLLQGIWRTLLIPEFEDIVFTSATADFEIKDKRIRTQNLFMTGKMADLNGQGWVDFDKNIRLTISPKFKETEILRSKTYLKKGPSSLLSQADGYLTIKVSGTLDSPSYEVVTMPSRIIEKTTDFLFEGVKGIFDEIFK